jgi:beta-lactamase regulating signal transducer with metallopeptidase domain
MIDAAHAVLEFLIAALWQDACIAIVAGAILFLAGRRLSATTRCFVLQGVLFALVAVPLVTTFSNVRSQPATVAGDAVTLRSAPAAVPSAAAVAAPAPIRVPSSDGIVLALAGAWLAGVVFFALRVAAGVLQLARLVRRSTRLADRGRVRVLASPDLSMPLAFGLTVPSVIVPAELAAAGGDDFACVLLHELAHVRRYDAWGNAFERLVQAVLYCNPAVVLVLRGIAFEREAACDDWAVVQSRDVDAYARSLASFALRRAEYRTVVACGVTAFGRATVARLRRLEDEHRNGAVTFARSVLGGFAIVLLALAFSIQMFAPSIAFATEAPVVAVAIDTGGCPKIVPGPSQLPRSIPQGLRSDVTVHVSTGGTIGEATLDKSSGNGVLDRLAASGARQLLVAMGKISPPRCSAPKPGTYSIARESGPVRKDGATRESRWTVKADWMKKSVVMGPSKL